LLSREASDRVLIASIEAQPIIRRRIPAQTCPQRGLPVSKQIVRGSEARADVLHIYRGILRGEDDRDWNEPIGSNLLLRKMTADMLEAYASLQRQAVQRPLILRKQGGKAGISFGSRSVQAVHGDLIGYAVQETI